MRILNIPEISRRDPAAKRSAEKFFYAEPTVFESDQFNTNFIGT